MENCDLNQNDTYTVLIAEDDPVTRKLLKSVIEKSCQYKVITANDGLEALQLIRNITPDVFIIDIMMPRLNGIETIKNIKLADRYFYVSDKYIIAMSAYMSDDIINQLSTLGVDIYLHKPVDTKEVINILQNQQKV